MTVSYVSRTATLRGVGKKGRKGKKQKEKVRAHLRCTWGTSGFFDTKKYIKGGSFPRSQAPLHPEPPEGPLHPFLAQFQEQTKSLPALPPLQMTAQKAREERSKETELQRMRQNYRKTHVCSGDVYMRVARRAPKACPLFFHVETVLGEDATSTDGKVLPKAMLLDPKMYERTIDAGGNAAKVAGIQDVINPLLRVPSNTDFKRNLQLARIRRARDRTNHKVARSPKRSPSKGGGLPTWKSNFVNSQTGMVEEDGRPSSASNTYITKCIELGLQPRPYFAKYSVEEGSFDLSGLGLSKRYAAALKAGILKLPSIVSLDISENNLKSSALCELLAAVRPRHFATLKVLRCCGNKIKPGGADTLVTFVASCEELEELHLNESELGDRLGAKVLRALRKLREPGKLRRLELASNELGAASVAALEELLREAAGLEVLSLSWNFPFGADKLLPALAAHPNLRLLKLRWCGIRDGAAVVRLIHGLRTLENLDVRSNKLSHDDLIAVHEAAEARGISVLAEDVDAGSPGRDHAPLLPALPPL